MPRAALKDNSRISLRIRAEDKAKIMRASALSRTDLTSFILRTAVQAADSVIEGSERIKLSKRDSMRLLDLLEKPPLPNAKLKAAARALAKRA